MQTTSVIIPTHNRAHILRDTLPTYLADPNVFEAIIINDGSTDDTEKVITGIMAADARVKLYTIKNSGAPAARNLGITKVSPDSSYIFFGEDDAFLEDYAITNLLRCLEYGGADIVGGRIIPIPDQNSSLVRISNEITRGNPVNLNLMRANFRIQTEGSVEVPFIHALFLAKRWVFNEVFFDEKYFGNAYREETDFCIEASRRGAKIIYCPDSALFHIEAPQGGQRRINKISYEYAVLKNNWYFLNKHYDYLKSRYGVITPKIFLQGALVLRRLYLFVKNALKYNR